MRGKKSNGGYSITLIDAVAMNGGDYGRTYKTDATSDAPVIIACDRGEVTMTIE